VAIISGSNAENTLRAWRAECRRSLHDFAGCNKPASGDVIYFDQFFGFRPGSFVPSNPRFPHLKIEMWGTQLLWLGKGGMARLVEVRGFPPLRQKNGAKDGAPSGERE
jgi:hypothetical protein